MLGSSVIDLIMRASEMSGKPTSAVFPLLPAVISRTHLGRVWLIRIAALLLLALTLTAGRRFRDARSFLAFVLGLTLVASMTESASGHASDKGDFSLREIMDWLHLLGTSVWGGGLLVLSLFVAPALLRPGDRSAQCIAGVAQRFSRIAAVAVATVALTALYNVWTYVGSFEALLKAPYGRTVLAKTALFLLLINLGAFNHYINVPLLQQWAGKSMDIRGIIDRAVRRLVVPFFGNQPGYSIAVRFRRMVRVEAFLIVVVLLCAAALRHEVPARHYLHLQHTKMEHAQQAPEPVVSLQTKPERIAVGIPVAMTVLIEDRDGKPLEGLEVSHERILHAIVIGKDLNVFAHIHPEDIGRITREMRKKATFPLSFTFPKAGEYLIGIDFAVAGQTHSKSFSLNVAGEPAMGGPKVDFSKTKDFGEYRVTLTTPEKVKAGEETRLAYFIERNGEAVKDLNPYLGAAMHLAVVPTDLKLFIHAHGITPGEPHHHMDHMDMHAHPPKRFGPEIDADVIFPVKGIYKIFSQVEHKGKVLLFDFMVNVE
jgi:putative copper export protein